MEQPYEQLREVGEADEHPHRKVLLRGCLVLIPLLLLVILATIIIHMALIVNISDYPYPRRTTHPHTVVLLATNDIHGYARGFHMRDPATHEEFTQGGLPYLVRMLRASRDEWGDSFLWVDAGDQYQGGIESSSLVSNGSIMMEVYNSLGLAFSAIGNHEFDYGPEFLQAYMGRARFPYLAANIYKSNTSEERAFLPQTRVSSLATLGNGAKVGLIGLTTIETLYTTTWFANKSNPQYDIREYSAIVREESAKLKKAGAQAVVLVSHVGNKCGWLLNRSALWNGTTAPRLEDCPPDEMAALLDSLPPDTVHAVVAGHVHQTLNHYYNRTVPVVQSVNGAREFHLLYLHFDRDGVLQRTEIEGPVPVCSAVYEDLRHCPYREQNARRQGLREYKFHESRVMKDAAAQAIIQKYEGAMHKYYQPIADNDLMLQISSDFENDLGNLVTDCIRNQTKADFSILNPGGFRSPIAPGEVNYADLYSVFPFANTVQTFEMTGQELFEAVSIVQHGKKGLYQTSGLAMQLVSAGRLLKSLTFFNGSAVTGGAVLRGSSIDFLLQGGDDFKQVINVTYVPKNVEDHGSLRDIVSQCFDRLDIINHSFVDPQHPRIKLT